jgi:predicted AAA+ superfamily ATPase
MTIPAGGTKMRRLIWDDLLAWKSRQNKKPLILRGVRQCGKTWLLNQFGQECYHSYAYFNFEGNPNFIYVMSA